MKHAAICLHFDSIAEFCGFPANFEDPAFLKAAERFLNIADKYQFKYSIFLIGKDLEKSQNRELVQQWTQKGHEIGNHSWSHPNNLGAMQAIDIQYQVEKAHDIIAETTGHEPKGFVAPGWSTSPDLLKVLIKLGYRYDASAFPSWIMYPALLKLLINQLGSRKFFQILKRKDFRLMLHGPKNAYRSSGDLFGKSTVAAQQITVLPMPVNKFRMGCWHTLAFSLGWHKYHKLLASCLNENSAFCYVVHPADLLDESDVKLSTNTTLERLSVPLEQKLHYLEQAIETIVSSRKLVKMEALASLSTASHAI